MAISPSWTSPETISGTTAGTIGIINLAMRNGRAVATWSENLNTQKAAYRPVGGPFGAPATLDSQSSVRASSVAIGADGRAIAVWGATNNTGPVKMLRIAELAAGTTTFGSASTLYTSSTNQDPNNPSVGYTASGDTLLVFQGDGTSGYGRVWSAERASGGGSFATAVRTGNYEVGGLKAAISSTGALFAYAYGVVQNPNHGFWGPRRNAAGTWFSETFASPYCCGTVAEQTPGSVVVDGSDNAYMTVSVASNASGHEGPNFVMQSSNGTVPQGPINPDEDAFPSSTGSSSPLAAVDAAGNAVMSWIRPDKSLYAAYRPAGGTSSFSTPELIATGIPSELFGDVGLVMDQFGNAIITWRESCTASGCTLKSKVRRRGASTSFASPLTIATGVRNDRASAIAVDGSKVGVIWRDVTTLNFKFSILDLLVPDHLTITSSTANLTSGASRAITAELRDVDENVINSDSSTVVAFAQTSGAGSVTGAGNGTASSGVASRTLTGAGAGSVTITASATGVTSGTTTFAVTAGAATNLAITSSTSALTSGAQRVLTAQIRDANGNVVTSDNSTVVTFAQTSGAGSVTGLGTATASSGVASKTVTGAVAGSVTISATVSGLTTGTTTFTVAVGAATQLVFTSATTDLAAGATRQLSAQIRDAGGNVVTGDSSTVVTFTQSAGAGSVSALGSATASAGVANRTVTGGTAGSVTITATASGLTDTSSSFTVVVGAPSSLVFTSSTAPMMIGASRGLTAVVRDAGGNLVTAPTSMSVTFQQSAGSGQVSGLSSSSPSSGVVSQTVTAVAAGSVTVTASADGVTSGSTTFTISSGPVFTDDPLAVGTTAKAVHVTELRDAINTLRARVQLPAASWTDSSLALIKAVHISEMRAALDEFYQASTRTPPLYSDATLTARSTVIKAVHIAELRAAVNAVW